MTSSPATLLITGADSASIVMGILVIHAYAQA